jgi:hypothetical protein
MCGPPRAQGCLHLGATRVDSGEKGRLFFLYPDAQELDTRCDVDGASGHVTTKPFICNRPAFYKSSVYAAKVSCLTPGDLSSASGRS